MKKTLLALAMVAVAGNVSAAGFKPTPAPEGVSLGAVTVDPYGGSPLTALIELDSKTPTDIHVTVKGKGKNGVDISYPVGQKSMLSHDGIPVLGLYADFRNTVVVDYTLDGKKHSDTYSILTGTLNNEYMNNLNVTAMQQVNVKKVNNKFKDRLYLVNSHTRTPQGSDIHWSGEKPKSATVYDSMPAGGAAVFDAAPMTYIVDTQGEYRWWLNQDAVYDGKEIDMNKRGYFMGLNPAQDGTFTFVQGQHWGTIDLMGKITTFRLPRGYVDATHEAVEMPNGNVLIRAAKRGYRNAVGDMVTTIRDQILEVDPRGRLVDVWDLNKILDPMRQDLLKGLDLGAVCLNVDLDAAGSTSGADELSKSPYGDMPGVMAGRNWIHVNSIAYDDKSDAIIISGRHQGVMKIGRDKKVDWILSPNTGWKGELASKVLQPVDKNGKKIDCDANGKCEGSDFDFTYTQHTAWISPKGTLTVFDNGDGRYYTQPAMFKDKYSRFVEYRIDEQKGTVEQVWEYGKERGWEWYSPITSNTEYRADRDTMFGFGGSVGLLNRNEPTIGKINEIDYKTKEVMVEIDVLSEKNNAPHYRALIVEPNKLYGR